MQDSVTVRDVMSREFVGVSESDDITDVLDVMIDEPVSSVVVLRGSSPVGVVHALDVLELVADRTGTEEVTVDEVMRTPPEPIDADQQIGAALDRLSSGWERQLPVVDADERLVGVVSESDVLAAAGSLFSTGDRPQERQPTVQADAEGGTGGVAESPRAGDAYTNHDGSTSVATTADTASDTGLTQGVCESCGSLVDDLGGYNGKLLCRECRDV